MPANGKLEPVLINSALVSAQNRERLYWCNWTVKQPEDKHIMLKDVIKDATTEREKSYCIDASYYKGGDIKSYKEKCRRQLVMCSRVSGSNQNNVCVQIGTANIKDNEQNKRVYSPAAKSPCLRTCSGGNQEPKISEDNITWRKLTVTECERLQTLPDGYCRAVSNSRAYHAIGNGWTVDIIAHIFRQIK